MVLTINGKQETIEESSLTVTQILEIQNVKMPDMVSVQLNGEFVDRADFASIQLKENDEIDFLYFMGGGK